MKKILILVSIGLMLFLAGCSNATGGAVFREPTCTSEPFVYKITNSEGKPTVQSTCSKYNYDNEKVCADRAWFSGRCLKYNTITHSECIEQTVKCSINVKNYESAVGRFGFKSYFNTRNGRIDKQTIWRDIYPQETENFAWSYITTPNELKISCGIIAEQIPQKEECK